MISSAIHFVLRWLSAELLRALLFSAWRFVLAAKGYYQDRAFVRFCRLVNAVPLFGYCVEFMHPREMEARAAAGLPCWQTLLVISAEEAARDRELWEENT